MLKIREDRKRFLTGLENELKSKWENEQKQRKINDLLEKLKNTRQELIEAIKKMEEYRNKWGESNDNYLREKARVEELEREAEGLESQLRNNN